VASGNEAQDSKNISPARISHPYVITVSAMDNNDNWAAFSNFGSSVDVASPGQFIQSTNLGGGITGFIQGTSFAAPHVAALKLGQTKKDGKVKNDPDGDADDIIVFKA
jgi:subtilisin family serine protease